MSWISGVRARLRQLFGRRAAEERMEEEIRFHLEMETEKNLRLGMSPAEARRRARLAFGGMEGHREVLREGWRLPLVEDAWREVRYALRTLRKSPGFTLAAVLTLALGIGANTAIFSVVSAVLLRPLPYSEAGRIVFLTEARENEPGSGGSTSYPNFADWQAQSTSFEAMAIFNGWTPALTGLGEPEVLQGALVTAGIFDVLRVQPLLGRPMALADNLPQSEPVAVLSYGFWQSRLGGDPQVIGRSLTVNGTQRTVIAVLPPEFRAPGELEGELWGNNYFDENDTRGSRYLRAMGRLRLGVTLAEARAEMRTLSARLAAEYPEDNLGMAAVVTPLRDQLFGSARQPLLILLGAAALVLLIACANLSNLVLTRGIARGRELAVRTALGASRGRIVHQLLAESLLLATLGALLGLLLAVWGTRALLALAPASVRVQEVTTDWRVLLFTLALTLGSTLLFGLFPALRSTRVDLQVALREAGRGATAGRSPARGALVVVQLGLALTLLVGAGLLLKSFARVQQVEPGIRPKNLLTVGINLPSTKYPAGTQPAFFGRLLEEVGALPEVRSAAVVSTLPFGGEWDRIAIDIEGQQVLPGTQKPEGDRYIVSPGYFATMGIPLREGRLLSEQDRYDGPLVAVVDEVFARRIAPGGSAIGLRSRLPGRDSLATIVGVVGHVKHYGLDASSQGQIYQSQLQYPWRWMQLVVRTEGEPLALAGSVRAAVRALDPDQPVFGISTMQRLMAERTASRRFSMVLLGLFAAVAVVIAGLGLYGVIAYGVVQRRAEIGIRLALGALPTDVVRMIVRQGLLLTALGGVIGLLAALLGARVLSGLLFGVAPADPLVLVEVSVMLLLIALLASYLPARRAARVDPMIALRAE